MALPNPVLESLVLLALVLLVGCCPGVVFAGEQPGPPGRLPMMGPQVNFSGARKALPFSARFEESRKASDDDGRGWTLALTGTVARDSGGRRRLTFSLPVVGIELGGVIEWPEENLLIVFDAVHRSYRRVVSGTGGSGDWYVIGGSEILSFADGDTQQFEGLHCRKVVASRPDGSLIEAWVSEEYGINLRETRVEAGQSIRWQLRDLETLEPAPELFQIPAGFSEERD